MAAQPNSLIKLELTLQPDRPELLEGLDLWLQLGLLSDLQVRRIGRQSLTCQLAEVVRPLITEDPVSQVAAPPQKASTVAATARDSWVTQALASLMAEISVIWLLFLGVFMVVVSSAVLAASQWRNFSIVGQFAILWVYTLAFGVAGIWSGARPNLRLTGRMLQIATLLIIPVNFWMIDGFNLWQSALGVGIIAALTLSGMSFWLLRTSSRLMLVNALGLCYLQWGWTLAGVPLAATYVGAIATALLQVRRVDRDEGRTPQPLDLGTIAIAFSTLLLIGRAILVKGVPLSHLGLALGICGWILCWVNRRRAQPLWTQTGAGLLVFGWLVTVTANQLWQALAVSGLVLWLLVDRLRQFWRVQEVVALILVGLQAYTLLRVIFPPTLRRSIMAMIATWANLALGAWELTGLGFFPYVLVILGFAVYLRRFAQRDGERSHSDKLATVAEQMALGLGVLLAIPGTFNPLVRAIYLMLSALTLGVILQQRSQARPWLIYLTHTTALLTLLAWIDWGLPDLSLSNWAIVLLGIMALEWGLCWIAPNRSWQISAWYLGLGLAGCSYWLLSSETAIDPYKSMIWLITPTLLTGLASRSDAGQRRFPPSRQATWLSVLALLLLPLLTIAAITPFLITVALATVLMMVNTRRLEHLAAAVITVGFGLSLATTIVWQVWGFIPTEWLAVWFAIALGGLWLLRHALRQRSTLISGLYTTAVNGWGIALSFTNLVWLTGVVLDRQLFSSSPIFWEYLVAIGLTTLAIAYRVWQQPSNLGLIGIAWSIELFAASLLNLTQGTLQELAIVNLVLGLATQLAGDWWLRHSAPGLKSLHGIPPVYALLGMVFAHHQFTAATGPYTFAAALTWMGVGRRQPQLKPLTYVGILAVSIAASEALIYQLLQASGVAFGDSTTFTLLAALATTIAVGYRLLARQLMSYWRLTRSEFLSITHGHWGVGSAIALIAIATPFTTAIGWIWTGVIILLAAYAIWQGRTIAGWVYFGVVEAVFAVSYWLDRLLPSTIVLPWGAAIASLLAYALYSLPWHTWGWSRRPWQNSAAILPGVAVFLTSDDIAVQSLLLTAAFYAWLARASAQVRLSYLALGLADWAILRLFDEWSLTDPLWWMTLVSGSLLYGVQVDPALRSSSQKEVRHLLRCLATGLFCLTALYQSEYSWSQGLLTIALSIALIAAGLALRVRAFLYLGTVTFILKVLRQLWLFINNESLILWALGIVLGLIFIWVAATFEARRSQAIALLQYWITELERWE